MTSKDSSHSYIHLHSARHADLFEDFARPGLPVGEPIQVAAHLQPPNPEDEDDVVPDQHAAFGIQRATQPRREPAWRDLGLTELVASQREQQSQSDATATLASTTQMDNPPAGQQGGATTNSLGIVGRPGRGRGAGWTRDGDNAVGVGVRYLPR